MGDLAGFSPLATTTPRQRWSGAPNLSRSPRWPEAARFIVVLLFLYTVKQVFSVAAFYPFSGHDELAHYSYVRTLVTEGRIPVLPDLELWRTELDGGEPPPTDQISSELYRYCRYTLDWYCEPSSPRWRDDPPRIVTVPGLGYFPSGYQYVANHPPLYYALMTPLYALSSAWPPVTQHYMLRLAAIPFGLLTVYATYRATRALFPGDAFLTVTAPAFVAFQPQISYEAAMVNNDIVAIALTSLLIWGVIVGIRDRFPMGLCVAMGVVLGLDLLAKSTAVTIAPVIAFAVVLAVGWRDWRGVLTRGLAIGVPAGIVAAPWYAFLYRTYGDFSGLARVEDLQYWNGPMGTFFELLTDPGFVAARFRETWGEFGWRLIHLRPALLWAIALVTIAALLGLVTYAIAAWRNTSLWRGGESLRPEPWQVKALVSLALACAVAYLAVIEFGTSFALSQARYFFPVVTAAALLAMLGLRTLIPPRIRPAGQGVFVAALVVLNIVIISAYVLPFTVTVDQPIVDWTWGG
ncbi:MAG: ArnT family glycosyltransferase [Thermomicrobiales bacterium]